MWVFFWVSVVIVFWILVEWVSWGCCQTISGIGGSINLVVFCLSVAAPEWRRGIFSLNFGLQLEELRWSHFGWLSLGFDSVSPIFCAGEAVEWLHWLQSNNSLWNGLFFDTSHRVFSFLLALLLFLLLLLLFVVIIIIVDVAIRVRVFGVNFFCFQEYFDCFQFVPANFSTSNTDLCNVLVLCSGAVGLGLPTLVFVCCWLTVFICSSALASKPFNSNSFSRCVTICSYVPFSKWAWFNDIFRCAGILA